MAPPQRRRSREKGTVHLRVVERADVTVCQEFRDGTLGVLDLPVLTVFSPDDEEYAADVARLVAQR